MIIGETLEAYPPITIRCAHCGEQEITIEKDIKTYLRFTGKASPTKPLTCPLCNEEASLVLRK